MDSRDSEPLLQGFTIGTETPEMDAHIIGMTDRAFGPGRYVKTAERLREGAVPYRDMSFVAQKNGRLAGSVRLWPIVVKTDETSETIAFLGPIVVEPEFRSLGLGKQLIRRALEAAARSGLRAVALVGDATYFGELGFARADLTLPGPVDPRRVLIHYFEDGVSLSGEITRAG
ncbi:GNAT family N-acetyltransferase [Asticcacaulis solisilvae]|uniref:GNAT family N-acetyltransferase n=1 Tax=Asticcacaulis solisilvae TaxID=1217274 RepID=UPI003FD7A1F1